MTPVVKNILAVLAGIILGSLVNMGIIMISGSVIPPPDGADVTTMEGLKESMHLFQPQHYIMPFLAHALGTLTGAFLCGIIAASHKTKLPFIIGIFFLAGGIANLFMLPSPVWFAFVDILLAYIPMAWIGGMLANRNMNK